MKIAKIVAWIGLLAMTGILINAFRVGDFGKDGVAILANPWGLVSIVDLYVGFSLFSAWIVFREKSLSVSIIWVILMMTLGFFTASLYTLIQLYKCKSDWPLFFLGHRKDNLITKIKN